MKMRLLCLLLTAAAACGPVQDSPEAPKPERSQLGLSIPLCTGADAPGYCRGRDVVYHEGRIWTGETDAPVFHAAMLVRAGKVVTVGTVAQVEAAAGPLRHYVRLWGRVVLPGLVDAHSHVAMLARQRWTVGAHPSTWAHGPGPTLAEASTLVSSRAATAPPGEPIVFFYGSGLYSELRAAGLTARAFLDGLTTSNPVYGLEWSGHAQAVNSVALLESGLRDYQPDPYGGWTGRDALGRHNGILQEFAVLAAVESLSSRISNEEYVEQHDAYDLGGLSKGIVATADFVFVYRDIRGQYIHERMRRPAALVPVCIITSEGKPCAPGPDGVVRRKVFADGTHVASSALVSLPYLNPSAMPDGFPTNTGLGIRNLTDAQFRLALQDTLTRGGLLAVHAIGDAGVEQVLRLLEERPDVDWSERVTLEHGDMANPGQVARAATIGVRWVQNGTHLALLPPMMFAGNEPALYAHAEPMRSLLDSGVRLALGTDAFGSDPADTSVAVSPNPWLDIMLTVVHPYYPHEGITVGQALGAYTRESASSRLLPGLGTLAAGKDATFFLPTKDPFAVTPDVLPGITSCMTVVSGTREWLDRSCFGAAGGDQ